MSISINIIDTKPLFYKLKLEFKNLKLKVVADNRNLRLIYQQITVMLFCLVTITNLYKVWPGLHCSLISYSPAIVMYLTHGSVW